MRALISLLIPALLIGCALYLDQRFAQLPVSTAWLLPLAPLIIIGISLAAAYRFNRVSIFFVGFALLLVQMAAGWVELYPRIAVTVAILAPLLIVILAVIPQRGILTLRALPRFAFIALIVAVTVWLVAFAPAEIASQLDRQWVPARYLDWTRLPQTAVGLLLVQFVLLLAFYLTRPSVDRAALLGVLVSLALLLHQGLTGSQLHWLMSAAGLTLLFAVLQETYRMAYMDELTELPARRALRERLARLGGSYTIAMLDVDHFKKFNDTYGHDVGDNVLRMIGARLRKVSGGGKPFRYGGEEFSVVFPGKGMADAKAHLESLRKTIADTPFNVRRQDRRRDGRRKSHGSRQKKVQVTISIGMAERNDNAKAAWDVLKTADRALYRAKKKGRNCISK